MAMKAKTPCKMRRMMTGLMSILRNSDCNVVGRLRSTLTKRRYVDDDVVADRVRRVYD